METEKLNIIFEQFKTINDSLTFFKMQVNTIQNQLKCIEKNVKKELKNNKKICKDDKPKKKRLPSGFAKPTKVTNELCEFMCQPAGTEIARTEVTKALVEYIQKNNLISKDKDSKQKIVPDDKLKHLLGLVDDCELDQLTYFSIQKYMNKHFISSKSAVAV